MGARKAKAPPKWTDFVEADVDVADGTDARVWFNSRYQVTMRSCGPAHWLAIVRRDREAIHDWRDLQRIKNELCGPEREGFELYPAESRLVDTNNQFHLFVMGEGAAIPFGYDERDVSEETTGMHRQRPFPEDARPPDLGRIPKTRSRVRTPKAKEDA